MDISEVLHHLVDNAPGWGPEMRAEAHQAVRESMQASDDQGKAIQALQAGYKTLAAGQGG